MVSSANIEVVRFPVANGADIHAKTLFSSFRVSPLDQAKTKMDVAKTASEKAEAKAVLAAIEGR